MYIDAHHHLWKFDPIDYDWIDDAMAVLQKDFLIKDLEKTLHHNGFSTSIAVQARQSMEETLWLLSLARAFELLRAVGEQKLINHNDILYLQAFVSRE